MALSSDLISQFVKITNDNRKPEGETTVYGTTVEYNGDIYVRLDGSDLLTPVSKTADVKPDERVAVRIKNHTATITGNVSSPAARTEDVQEIADEVSEFEIVISHRVVAEELEAANATFESLKAKVAIYTEMESVYASIEQLQAKYASLEYVSAEDAKILNAEIDTLKAGIGEFTSISTEDLEAMNADIATLHGYTAEFTYVSAEVLQAVKADIKQLTTEKLSAKDAELKYANIDFTNIGEAAIDSFYAKSGIINKVTISEGVVVKELVGVTIKGDLIEGGTVKADKLVVKGTDGLFYKLNFESGKFAEGEVVPKDSLHGSVITAKSIVAEQISVDDLVAFGATIGGFKITENSIYSGVKETVDNSTRGVYLDNEGQVAFGDASNFLRYYKDRNGNYKLEISASSVLLRSGTTTNLEEIASEAQKAIDAVKDIEQKIEDGNFSGEDATVLRIDSSRGTVFKNNQVSTVLSAVIYYGSKRITDITALKETYGQGAYLEWSWQRMDEDRFGVISSDDPRISNGGFTFTISADDVDTKVVFMCSLNV